MKTKVEIIKEVMQGYIDNPSTRAIYRNGLCDYLTEDGRMCAVGKCMKEGEWQKEPGSIFAVFGIYTPDQIFKPDYLIEDLTFWQELQQLHDDSINWADNGLSKDGEKKYNKLINKYSNETSVN